LASSYAPIGLADHAVTYSK